MSSALRIASVTQVLKDLLDNGLIDHDITGLTGQIVTVTSWPPDKIETEKGKEVSQLNIFMYQVTYNQGWRNVAHPSFNQKGERISNPPLAIDLHYLLTAYGSAELHTDILLGYGMQLFHETPVLTRDAIRKAIGPPSLLTGGTNLPSSLRLLSRSELSEQVEQIRITPEVMNIEDISKLWAAIGAKYRPTATYKATVVLIESNKSTKPGLPVKARNLYVKPFKIPVIEKILSQSGAGQPIRDDQKILPGYRLILDGNNFLDANAEVHIDGAKIDPVATNMVIESKLLSFDLPTLSSGIHEVQVVHPMPMGNESPPALHEGVSSVSKSFLLSPELIAAPTESGTTGTGNQLRSTTIGLKVDPFVNPGQRVVLLLNERTNTNAKAYSFQMPTSAFGSPPQPIQDIFIQVTKVKAGDYLVRIEVDGADSELQNDAQGKYVAPIVNIP